MRTIGIQRYPNLPGNQQTVQRLVDHYNQDERDWTMNARLPDPTNTVSVLGIDAAWTTDQPSGVALVAKQGTERWRCLSVAPSYATFLQTADGIPVEWEINRHCGGMPDVERLLSAASRILGGKSVEIVAIDMPVSREAITGRRPADNAISSKFGAAGCSTHSPGPIRPGALDANLTAAFRDAGYPVAAADDRCGTLSRLIEVYPHPALLRLLNAERRIEYKVSKSGKYWPNTSVRVRIRKLLDIYAHILQALRHEVDGINLPLPQPHSCAGLSGLKRYEDALDALICAWVGCCYIEGKAAPFGDTTAAIWVPTARLCG